MLVIAKSSFKDLKGQVIRDADTAYEEGLRASKIIGAELICLDYETLHVPFDESLTKKLMCFVEDNIIDTIYSPWVHDVHRDHHYTGRNTLMAGRHVPRFLMYRSNYYDSVQPFKGNFYSDISEVMDKKIEVIKAHKSELQRVRYKWLEFFTNQNANDGKRIGTKYAECFEVVRYLMD